jgi:hypothetical protein
MTALVRRLPTAFPLLVFYTLPGQCNILLFYYCTPYYPTIWYDKFTSWNFRCKEEASTSVLPLYTIVEQPDYGRNRRSKHVVVNVINK